MEEDKKLKTNYLKKDLVVIMGLILLFTGIFTVVYFIDQSTGDLSEIAKQLYSTFIN
ncbi:MAG: hypothetical protein ABID45_01250 [Patescibacteria group bacterium]